MTTKKDNLETLLGTKDGKMWIETQADLLYNEERKKWLLRLKEAVSEGRQTYAKVVSQAIQVEKTLYEKGYYHFDAKLDYKWQYIPKNK